MLALVLLSALALAAGVLGGVVGTGSSMILLPVLVWLYGPRAAVPVMGVAAVMGNVGRVVAWWSRIRWKPVAAYALPGIPAAVLGARTLLTVPPTLVDGCLALFFIAVIPLRRAAARAQWRLRTWQMALAGAAVGFLTGMVLSTGPLSVPVFTGYGLTNGAFLGSEAASALLLYAGKLATFGGAGVLSADVVIRGLVIGAALMTGSLLARRIVRAIPAHRHAVLIDMVLASAAAGMLLSAWR
ncbi:sulfite exporter TauE/SafE family protein [Streptomyces hygroscopicus]|uniref:sulfite exporter TauE/SafE family protein n=1 Tax=Streptomyces hygroscopicus TaxID=1912 RepID=UPI000783E731|nr:MULTISPECIES: sulfite exporter TauE/SafE family protein [Streptomyces]MBW8092954.1 sulfite exporter TauE/SafE family protein [Streptomyces hygroscopicus subsp. hygroscopicus]